MAQSSLASFFQKSKLSYNVVQDYQIFLPVQDIGSVPKVPYKGGSRWYLPKQAEITKRHFEIIKSMICFNTFLTLPKSYGKNILASFVLYNFYKWFPNGISIFLAPTKEMLLTQYEVILENTLIPSNDIFLSKSVNFPEQEQQYKSQPIAINRLNLTTPYTLHRELIINEYAFDDLVCLIIDEAHNAVRDPVYAKVIDLLLNSKRGFRIISMSEIFTTNIDYMQQLINVFKVTKFEVYQHSEDSLRQFISSPNVEILHVTIFENKKTILKLIRLLIKQILQDVVDKGILSQSDVVQVSKNNLLNLQVRLQKQKKEICANIGEESYIVLQGKLSEINSIFNLETQLTKCGVQKLSEALYHFQRIERIRKDQINFRRQVISTNLFDQLSEMVENTLNDTLSPKIGLLNQLLQETSSSNQQNYIIILADNHQNGKVLLQNFQLNMPALQVRLLIPPNDYQNLSQIYITSVINEYNQGTISAIILNQFDILQRIEQIKNMIVFDCQLHLISLIQSAVKIYKQMRIVAFATWEYTDLNNGDQSYNWVNSLKKHDIFLKYFKFNSRIFPTQIRSLSLKRFDISYDKVGDFMQTPKSRLEDNHLTYTERINKISQLNGIAASGLRKFANRLQPVKSKFVQNVIGNKRFKINKNKFDI